MLKLKPNVSEHVTTRTAGVSDGWYKQSSSYWRDQCRQHSFKGRSLIKRAELGGQPTVPFEQAFSNLAHSYISDKAPKLLEYEAGFQLIEKSEDNTKSVGIFGFKIGNQWLYAPVFFLNGDLRGHELLYIKNQDLFVPLKDNWVNYLLGRKPNLLGKGVPRDLARLGVLQPNLYQLSRSPYKIASASAKNMPDLAEWAIDFLPTLAKLAMTKLAAAEPLFLRAVRVSGRDGFGYLTKLAEQYPTVYQCVQECYGDEALHKMAQDIGADRRYEASQSIFKKLAAPKAKPPLTIKSLLKKADAQAPGADNIKPKDFDLEDTAIVMRVDLADGGHPVMHLTDEEKTKVMEEGRLVKDNREEASISKVYNMSTSLKVFTPTETNIFEVAVKPDKFEKCLVLMGPYCEHGRKGWCTVVSLESDKRWINIHPSRVLCVTEHSRDAFNEWFDKLEDAKELPVSESLYHGGTQFMLISRNGQGTCPIRVNDKVSDSHEGATYSVHFDDHCSYTGGSFNHEFTHFGGEMKYPFPAHYREEEATVKSIRLTGRDGTKFRMGRDELYVPAGFKKLVIAKEKKEDYDTSCCEGGQSEKKPLQPSSMSDIMFAIHAGLPPMRISTDKVDYTINDKKMNKDAAFKHLMLDWRLRESTADLLLKKAEELPRETTEYRVKRAGPYLTESGPGAPGFPEPPTQTDHFSNTQTPMQEPYEWQQYVPSMQANHADRELYRPIGPDPDTMQIASQAASSGQKEVFDTAMLGSLLNTVRQDSMIDRYLGDLMKGMDRLGRIYFQRLWHGQEFEDRFGASELPELEDGIRNTFEGLGDIVLKLKQKGVEPFSAEGTDVDLGGIANQ